MGQSYWCGTALRTRYWYGTNLQFHGQYALLRRNWFRKCCRFKKSIVPSRKNLPSWDSLAYSSRFKYGTLDIKIRSKQGKVICYSGLVIGVRKFSRFGRYSFPISNRNAALGEVQVSSQDFGPNYRFKTVYEPAKYSHRRPIVDSGQFTQYTSHCSGTTYFTWRKIVLAHACFFQSAFVFR